MIEMSKISVIFLIVNESSDFGIATNNTVNILEIRNLTVLVR